MSEHFELTAEEEHAGLRLDVFLADVVEDSSRSLIKKLIKDRTLHEAGAHHVGR